MSGPMPAARRNPGLPVEKPRTPTSRRGTAGPSAPNNGRWRTAAAPRMPQADGPRRRGPVLPAGTSASELGAVGQVSVDQVVATALRTAALPGTSHQRRALFSELAHRLTQRTHAAFTPLAMDAARLRAEVLDEQGEHTQAGRLWGRLVSLYQLAHRRDAEQHARLAHAIDLHRTGQCGEALNQMSCAWIAARQPGLQQPSAPTVLALYAAMLGACGQSSDRDALLAEAQPHPRHETAGQQPAPHSDSEPEEGKAWLADIEPADEHQRCCAYHAYAQRQGHPS
ncbi:hypothetical protein ACQP2F_33210 [Actinoplanes sp. CA-030573]|uniref:hypothetical protein n=1 Tax=Actinoplanes sp. CA-030573 TaxID=3239898 RepID=UPI003D8CCEAC